MSAPSQSVLNKNRQGTIQEYAKKPAEAGFYNTNSGSIDTILYPGRLTPTPETGVTFLTSSFGQPAGVSDYSLYSPFSRYDNQPMVSSSSQNYPILNVISGKGVSFAGASFGLDIGDYVNLVVAVSAPMTLTVTITDDGAKTATYTTQNITATSWVPIKIPFSKFTIATGFNFNNGAKSIKIAGSVAGNVSFYEFDIANNDMCFIGSLLKVTFDCYLDFSMEDKRKIEKLMCFNTVDGTVVSEQENNIKLKTAKTDYVLQNIMTGQVIKNGMAPNRDYLTVAPIVSNNTTLPIGLNPKALTITLNGITLTLADTLDQLIDYRTFFYTPTTGVLLFAPNVYNGQTPLVAILNLKQGNYFHDQNLASSFYGSMNFGRQSATSEKFVYAYKIQVSDIKEKQGKGSLEFEYNINILPLDILENGQLNKRFITTSVF